MTGVPSTAPPLPFQSSHDEPDHGLALATVREDNVELVSIHAQTLSPS